MHETLGQIVGQLQTTGVDGSLGTANSLWIANHHPLTREFEALAVSQHYQSEIPTVDLASAATTAEMNRWVAERTFGRITDLIGELDVDSRLVLINALAFRGKWLTPFLPDATDDDFFTLADGRRRTVPMMSRVMRVGYAERENLQAVDLAYQGGRLSMPIRLPSAHTGLGRLEDTLSAQALSALDSELRAREVSVSLPRFKISTAGSRVLTMKRSGSGTASTATCGLLRHQRSPAARHGGAQRLGHSAEGLGRRERGGHGGRGRDRRHDQPMRSLTVAREARHSGVSRSLPLPLRHPRLRERRDPVHRPSDWLGFRGDRGFR